MGKKRAESRVKAKAKDKVTRQKKKPALKYCKCPNCCSQAIRFERKIICEHCDTVFIEKKPNLFTVGKIGVTQEIEKPKRKKGGVWP